MRKRRRIGVYIGIAAVLLAVAAGAIWWFRVPLLKLIPTPPVVITEKSGGTTVYLTPGQRLEVRLPANRFAASRWREGIVVPFLQQQGDPTFTETDAPAKPGDGYQSTTFLVTDTGMGPLFMGYMPDSDQSGYAPTQSFRLVVVSR
jgi:hypothetical protein